MCNRRLVYCVTYRYIVVPVERGVVWWSLLLLSQMCWLVLKVSIVMKKEDFEHCWVIARSKLSFGCTEPILLFVQKEIQNKSGKRGKSLQLELIFPLGETLIKPVFLAANCVDIHVAKCVQNGVNALSFMVKNGFSSNSSKFRLLWTLTILCEFHYHVEQTFLKECMERLYTSNVIISNDTTEEF